MERIVEFFKSITTNQIIDICIAVGIIVIFRIFSSTLSYIIIKMFKIKEKKNKKIKESAFYNPLRIFFILFGFYVAILFLKIPLKISEEIMVIVNRAFVIITTIVFAKGLAASFMPQSSLYKKIKEKTGKQNETDTMFDFSLKLVRIVIYILAVFIIITNLGIDLSGLIAGLGLGGVIVTLAAQDTAKNLFGGLVIFLEFK